MLEQNNSLPPQEVFILRVWISQDNHVFLQGQIKHLQTGISHPVMGFETIHAALERFSGEDGIISLNQDKGEEDEMNSTPRFSDQQKKTRGGLK